MLKIEGKAARGTSWCCRLKCHLPKQSSSATSRMLIQFVICTQWLLHGRLYNNHNARRWPRFLVKSMDHKKRKLKPKKACVLNSANGLGNWSSDIAELWLKNPQSPKGPRAEGTPLGGDALAVLLQGGVVEGKLGPLRLLYQLGMRRGYARCLPAGFIRCVWRRTIEKVPSSSRCLHRRPPCRCAAISSDVQTNSDLVWPGFGTRAGGLWWLWIAVYGGCSGA